MNFPLINEDTALSISLTSQSSTRSGFCKTRHSNKSIGTELPEATFESLHRNEAILTVG